MRSRPLYPVFCVLVGLPLISSANMQGTFQNNQGLGSSLISEAQKGITSGSMPLEGMGKESSLTEASVAQDQVDSALKSSEMGQWIIQQEKRPDKKYVVIDPVHDPLMKASTEVIQDPLKVLKAEMTVIEEKENDTDQEYACEEPSEPIELSCVQNLNVNVHNPGYESHIVTAVISKPVWGSGGRDPIVSLWDNNLYQTGVHKLCVTYCMPGSGSVTPNITSLVQQAEPGTISSKLISSNIFVERNPWSYGKKAPEKVPGVHYFHTRFGFWGDYATDHLRFEVIFKKRPTLTEQWQSGCAALEALRNDEGQSPCDLIEEKCTQGPETRVINGLPVYRDCWQKTRYYLCGSPQNGTCGEYRIRGCTQTNSECIQKVGEHCIRWKQTYRCKKTGLTRKRTSIKGEEAPWCLDGNCYSPMWEANTDMLNAISKMAVLAQIQKDMKDLNVFTGRGLQCRRGCLDFQNCCGTERGWGLSMKFASCNDEEKLLAQKQKNGLCVFLGTYCAKKVLGVCVQKRSTSCCFESKIARLIQVAAHHQLGIPWGSPENPQCRGLTPEELSRLDLEKVDFSELYEEIIARYKAPQVIMPQKDTLSQTVKGVSRGEPVAAKEGL